MRAFIRYQGLQTDGPDKETIEAELDDYFYSLGLPIGEEVRKFPLRENGYRGDTDHKMLWTALSSIGRSECYEHANLIGKMYWNWPLPEVSEHRQTIISHYNETQSVFHQIPPEDRARISSLGTQYRLWRHLQLVNHPCLSSQFKIAENSDSIGIHNRLWEKMCEGCQNPDIRYIPE